MLINMQVLELSPGDLSSYNWFMYERTRKEVSTFYSVIKCIDLLLTAWGWAKFLHTGDKVKFQNILSGFVLNCILTHAQVFYDFDKVQSEIEQETDKIAGQNKVIGP